MSDSSSLGLEEKLISQLRILLFSHCYDDQENTVRFLSACDDTDGGLGGPNSFTNVEKGADDGGCDQGQAGGDDGGRGAERDQHHHHHHHQAL